MEIIGIMEIIIYRYPAPFGMVGTESKKGGKDSSLQEIESCFVFCLIIRVVID